MKAQNSETHDKCYCFYCDNSHQCISDKTLLFLGRQKAGNLPFQKCFPKRTNFSRQWGSLFTSSYCHSLQWRRLSSRIRAVQLSIPQSRLPWSYPKNEVLFRSWHFIIASWLYLLKYVFTLFLFLISGWTKSKLQLFASNAWKLWPTSIIKVSFIAILNPIRFYWVLTEK